MKTIVITGSTRGIGFGLAQEFLRLGCQVMINGRSESAVQSALERLAVIAGAERVHGLAGSAANPADLEALWQAAVARFGRVDIWINNAGISNRLREFWLLDPDEMRSVVETNLLGAMYGSRLAIQGMRQQGGGAVYNLEGLGSDRGARKVHGLAVYGTTKAAIRYLNDALMREAQGTGVLIGAIQPGMVFTDMILTQYQNDPQGWQKNQRILTILSQPVEAVAPKLARRILLNTKNGTRIKGSSFFRVFWRFLTAAFKPNRAARSPE